MREQQKASGPSPRARSTVEWNARFRFHTAAYVPWDLLWNRNYFDFSRGPLCSGGYRASINNHRSPSKPHRLPSLSIYVRQISKRGNNEIKNECPRSREDALQKDPPARLYLSIHSADALALPRTFMLHMNARDGWGGGVGGQSAFQRQQHVVIFLTRRRAQNTDSLHVWAQARFSIGLHQLFFSPTSHRLQLLRVGVFQLRPSEMERRHRVEQTALQSHNSSRFSGGNMQEKTRTRKTSLSPEVFFCQP